jgi:hypothetical protein
VAEVADGLTETTAGHQRSGLPPAAAARAAVAEFGDAQLIAAGFGPELAADTGRRIGLRLLATGPLVGLAWLGTALASSDTAGISPPAGLLVLAIVFGAILAVAVPAAGVSVLATGRVSRWLPIGRRRRPPRPAWRQPRLPAANATTAIRSRCQSSPSRSRAMTVAEANPTARDQK